MRHLRVLVLTVALSLPVLPASTFAHECTAKVSLSGQELVEDTSFKKATAFFTVEGGMWMTTDWGALHCTVIWKYQVFYVDANGQQQRTSLQTGSAEFFAKRSPKQGERISESFSKEIQEDAILTRRGTDLGNVPAIRIIKVTVSDISTYAG